MKLDKTEIYASFNPALSSISVLLWLIPAIIYWQLINRVVPAQASESNISWTQQANLTASDGEEYDALGYAIAISGNIIVVGAPGDNNEKGAVYVFVKPTDGWAAMTQVAKLTASDGDAEDWFGYSVAIDGDVVVVGSLGGTYGASTVPGSAYVFVKSTGGWSDMTQTAKLTASDGVANDQFGYSVAIDGDIIAVGAIYQNSIYVFEKPIDGWSDMTQTARLTATGTSTDDHLGSSVAIDEDTIVAGAAGQVSTHRGSAYVFTDLIGGWIDMTQSAKLTASDGEIGDGFGKSISICDDTVVVGAPYDQIGSNSQQGSAYVFVKPIGGWITTTQTAKLTASNGEMADTLGWSVDTSNDRIVVGAIFDDIGTSIDQGSAYVFDRPSLGWADRTETAQIIVADGMTNDYFGGSVSTDKNILAIGAYGDDVNENTSQGSAYIFKLESRIYFPLLLK